MTETSASLLERLRERPDPTDWKRFVDLYTPWIRHWLLRQKIREHDADDLTQDVLMAAVQELPKFRYDPAQGKFRNWLRTMTVNRLRAFRKSQRFQATAAGGSVAADFIEQLADPASDLSRQWDLEHDAYLMRRAMTLIEHEFKPDTWHVFQRVVIEGQPPERVAAEFGITRNAVYIAQSRVLSRLRQELKGLCD
ncbi:MAG: sigma-70 family RNA polymerase sigma factor [Planctomycetes bacterium]|nr:sigma-70 family RNA polymerase sigma factor [Planctomycetota bacterium]